MVLYKKIMNQEVQNSMSDNKNKALTLEERRIIETGIRNNSTKVAIAKTLGKDKSTIGKEIRLHRYPSYKSTLKRECSSYKKCKHGRKCPEGCPDYIRFKCSRRDRSPGACNGCSSRSSCRFDKFLYDAVKADKEYHTMLVDSRSGVNLTEEEAMEIASVIKPLIAQGLSPYRIVTIHPELGISEKTLYNYIEGQVFSFAKIKDVDLRRKTSRRINKKKTASYKKRQDRTFLRGRLYEDYQNYINENPLTHVVQMDTVYNDVTKGPFIQTFKFIGLGLMLAVYHDSKTAQDMVNGVDLMDTVLGDALFHTYTQVLLTDRGSEFSAAEHIEMRPDGTRRTRVFYCDPMQSCQKGSLEVNHVQLRYILPKGTDLRALGLTGQTALNLALSHINSAPVESLHDKSPIEYTRFLCPQLWERLKDFGLEEIKKDDIILKPYLLKRFLNT